MGIENEIVLVRRGSGLVKTHQEIEAGYTKTTVSQRRSALPTQPDTSHSGAVDCCRRPSDGVARCSEYAASQAPLVVALSRRCQR